MEPGCCDVPPKSEGSSAKAKVSTQVANTQTDQLCLLQGHEALRLIALLRHDQRLYTACAAVPHQSTGKQEYSEQKQEKGH